MAFPVSSRTTGTLITESIWNSDIVDNLNYLKGLAGPVEIEDDLSLAVGKSFLADLIYAKDFVVHQAIRSMVVTFEDGIGQISEIAGGGGNNGAGGSGQWLLYVDDDVNGSNSSLNNKAESANAKDTSFSISKNPYLRAEFAITSKAMTQVFIGWRRTPGNSIPGVAENHGGLFLDNQTWFAGTSNGASASTSPLASQPTDGARHIVEVFIISATSMKITIDGVLQATMTVTLPTGDAEWAIMLYSEGGGVPGNHQYLNAGKIIAQENLA